MGRYVVHPDPELQPSLFPDETPPSVMYVTELAESVDSSAKEDERPFAGYNTENPAPEPSLRGPGFVTFQEHEYHLSMVPFCFSRAAQAEGRRKGVLTPYTRQRLEHVYQKPALQIAGEAVAARKDYLRQAREHLARASGLFGLQKAGIEDADREEASRWNTFYQKNWHM